MREVSTITAYTVKTLAIIVTLFATPHASRADETWQQRAVGSIERAKLVQAKLQGFEEGDLQLTPQEAFDFMSARMLELKAHPLPQLRTITFGAQAPSIGTFNSQTFWIGWNGSFSDSYAPEYENYAWVVYFSPEAVWVALQSAKGVYSGVSVYAGLGTFIGTLMSPDGAQLTKSYINDLLGVTLTVANGFKGAPFGPLSNLSMSVERGLTFLRRGDVTRLERGYQYNYGISVSYELISIPLPGSVSLDTESKMDAGFYPVIAWEVPEGARPIDAIIPALEILAKGKGSTYVALISKQFSQLLLTFLKPLKVKGTVVLQDNVPPTPAQFFNQPLPGQPGASSVNTSISHLIGEVEQWLTSGQTGGLPEALKNGVPGQSAVDGDPWDIFKPIRSATGLAFELGYKLGCDANSSCTAKYADCVKKVSCAAGKTCSIIVPVKEITDLVAGSSPADFEGAAVYFDNSAESFLATQNSETAVTLTQGKAQLDFVQVSPDPQLVGVRLARSAATGNRNLELCRRVVELRPTVQLKALSTGAAEAGRRAALIKILRTGTSTDPLDVSYSLSGSAKNGTDYTRLSGSARIPAGKSSVTVRIKPIDDKRREGKENVKLKLVASPGYTLGPANTAEAVIADND
jgi:hypothetical protein